MVFGQITEMVIMISTCDIVGSAPILTIDEIKGGFGVKASLSNIGNAPAEDVSWSIDISGGSILLGSQQKVLSIPCWK